MLRYQLWLLASTNEWHVGGHNRHELHVCVEREPGHIDDGAGHILDVHQGFGPDRAVRLHDTGTHDFGHFAGGIANIDLAACNIVSTPIERSRLRQACDRVLGGGVAGRLRARRVSRDGAVVDDAASRGFCSFMMRKAPCVHRK